MGAQHGLGEEARLALTSKGQITFWPFPRSQPNHILASFHPLVLCKCGILPWTMVLIPLGLPKPDSCSSLASQREVSPLLEALRWAQLGSPWASWGWERALCKKEGKEAQPSPMGHLDGFPWPVAAWTLCWMWALVQDQAWAGGEQSLSQNVIVTWGL